MADHGRSGLPRLLDLDSDGLYEQAIPEDEERELRRSGSGWVLADLDGTVMAFDEQGRWLRTEDPHGNAKIATYAGDQLAQVSMPDGRREDFSYHPDGKLAAIHEVGIDGSTRSCLALYLAGR